MPHSFCWGSFSHNHMFSLTLFMNPQWEKYEVISSLTGYSEFSLTQALIYSFFLHLGGIRKTRTTWRARIAWPSCKSLVWNELVGVITMVLSWNCVIKLYFKIKGISLADFLLENSLIPFLFLFFRAWKAQLVCLDSLVWKDIEWVVSKLTLRLFHLVMFIYLANFVGQLSVCQKWLTPASCLGGFFFFFNFLNLSTLLTKSTTYFT